MGGEERFPKIIRAFRVKVLSHESNLRSRGGNDCRAVSTRLDMRVSSKVLPFVAFAISLSLSLRR